MGFNLDPPQNLAESLRDLLAALPSEERAEVLYRLANVFVESQTSPEVEHGPPQSAVTLGADRELPVGSKPLVYGTILTESLPSIA